MAVDHIVRTMFVAAQEGSLEPAMVASVAKTSAVDTEDFQEGMVEDLAVAKPFKSRYILVSHAVEALAQVVVAVRLAIRDIVHAHQIV